MPARPDPLSPFQLPIPLAAWVSHARVLLLPAAESIPIPSHRRTETPFSGAQAPSDPGCGVGTRATCADGRGHADPARGLREAEIAHPAGVASPIDGHPTGRGHHVQEKGSRTTGRRGPGRPHGRTHDLFEVPHELQLCVRRLFRYAESLATAPVPSRTGPARPSTDTTPAGVAGAPPRTLCNRFLTLPSYPRTRRVVIGSGRQPG